jgi:3-deoxy-D-manno-octulosonic acid kinase
VTLPDGLHPVAARGALAFAAPEVEAWVRGALAAAGRLYEAAVAHAEFSLEGRARVPVVRTSSGRWVVRRYQRGGLVAGPLLRDRYLRVGRPRPLVEASASAETLRRGIATPRVMAGAVYPSGPFYRADLVTEYVANGGDLARALFHDERTPAERTQILHAVGGLIARAAASGIEHVDLNAKNVLLDATPGGATPLLLDLDRCRVLPPGVPGDPIPMLERLERSLRKLAQRTGRGLGKSEWASLRAGAGVRG